jgi:hypothetical protein
MISLHTKLTVDLETYAYAGAIVKDCRGNLLIITVRDLLADGSQLHALDANETPEVGTRSGAYFHQEGVSESAIKLLGWFRPGTLVSGDSDDLPQNPVDSDGALLGKRVVIPSIDASGVIYGTNAFARFRFADIDQTLTIRGLIRIAGRAQCGSAADLGCAGASVFLETGLLGIVVGVVDDDLLVAPIDRVLAAEDLQLASSQDVLEHNLACAQRAQPKQATTKTIEAVRDALGAAVAGLSGWEAVLETWIVKSWQMHLDGKEGFAPYRDLFRGMTKNPEVLFRRLWKFGLTFLDGDAVTAKWEDVIYRACATIRSVDIPETTKKYPELVGEGSHDLVARDGHHRDAA